MWENETALWDRLKNETRPIVLYGMGNGAEKILAQCAAYNLTVSDIFASDDFVRGHSFAGFPVRTYAEIQQKYTDCIILLAFAVFRPELLRRVEEISTRYEVLAPDLPLFGEELFTAASARLYRPELEELMGLLADERSRRTLDALLRYKINGKIACLKEAETPREEVFSSLLRFSTDEVYADLGAYDGDTVEEFRQQTGGRFARVLALEPDPKNFARLTAAAAKWNDPRIELFSCGAWSGDTVLNFSGHGGRSACHCAEGCPVPVRSLDSLLSGARASYIKMDVEGAEHEALFGCRETIRRFAPKLAVSAYHRGFDFFRLPLMLHRMNPHYRIYLRHHPYIPAWETNVYAVVR